MTLLTADVVTVPAAPLLGDRAGTRMAPRSMLEADLPDAARTALAPADAVGRCLGQRGRVRQDMAPGCPEKWDLPFLLWIRRFGRDVRPLLLRRLAEFEAKGGRVITLRSRAEADGFLASLQAPEFDRRTPSGPPIRF